MTQIRSLQIPQTYVEICLFVHFFFRGNHSSKTLVNVFAHKARLIHSVNPQILKNLTLTKHFWWLWYRPLFVVICCYCLCYQLICGSTRFKAALFYTSIFIGQLIMWKLKDWFRLNLKWVMPWLHPPPQIVDEVMLAKELTLLFMSIPLQLAAVKC